MSDLFEDQVGFARPPAIIKGLGTAIAGGKGALSTVERRSNDYYPTPAEVTRAFLHHEATAIKAHGSSVWEPCARGGAIMNELRDFGLKPIGTDIIADPQHNVEPQNVLTAQVAPSRTAITNPPFTIARDIIEHLLDDLGVQYLALLLKSQYWHAENRTGLFRRRRPARILALNWRPDFIGGGAPTMDCQWTVWDSSHSGPTTYDVIEPVNEQDGFSF